MNMKKVLSILTIIIFFSCQGNELTKKDGEKYWCSKQKKILEKDPDNSMANFAVGYSYYKEKKYNDAITYFNKINKNSPLHYYGKALIFKDTNQTNQSEKQFEIAKDKFEIGVQTETNKIIYYNYLNDCYYNLWLRKKEPRLKKKALESLKIYKQLVLKKEYKIDEKEKKYESLLKKNPDDKETLFKLGIVYYRYGEAFEKQEKILKAIRIFKKLIKIEGAKKWKTYYYLAKSYYENNDYEKSLLNFQESLKLCHEEKKWLSIMTYLKYCYQELGKKKLYNKFFNSISVINKLIINDRKKEANIKIKELRMEILNQNNGE